MSSLDIDLAHSKVLLIGTSKIQDEFLPDIPQVVNNVNDLKELFLDPDIFGFEEENVIALLNKDSNSIVANMEKVCYLIKDTLILYYSGHAYLNSNKLFLTGKTSNAIHKHSSCVDFDTVVSILRNSDVLKKILILDCCHSGSATNFLGAGTPYIHAKPEYGKGFAILTASGLSEIAGFDQQNRNTEYTGSLIQLLTLGLESEKLFIHLDDVHNYIKNNHVNRFTSIHGNTPTFVNKLGDSFKFANNIAVLRQKQNEEETKDTGDAENSVDPIHQSLAQAGSLQRSFFNTNALFAEYRNAFILNLYRHSIGGDFYYVNKYKGKLFVIVADCPHMGLPAALWITLLIKSLDDFLRYSNISSDYSASDLLLQLNAEFRILAQHSSGESQFMAEAKLGVCVIDRKYGLMSFSGAGMNLLYYDIHQGQKELEGERDGISGGNVAASFNSYFLKTNTVLRLYMYTDGFYTQTGSADGSPYSHMAFKELLNSLQGHDMPVQQHKLAKAFHQYKGSQKQHDDVLVIGIEFVPAPKPGLVNEQAGTEVLLDKPFIRPTHISQYKVPEGVDLTQQHLRVRDTSKTPRIMCNAVKGVIDISGNSGMDHPQEFYTPLILWVQQYAATPAVSTTVNLQLNSFNISSAKQLMAVLKEFETIYRSGAEVAINWYYQEDDDDMLEAGEDFESMVHVPFKMIECSG